MSGMTSSMRSPEEDLAACHQLSMVDMNRGACGTYDDNLGSKIHKGRFK